MVEKENKTPQIESMEIPNKERTALSILCGLRQKFTREANKDPMNYNSNELSMMISDLMRLINKDEVEIYERDHYIQNDSSLDDPFWGKIDEQVQRSKIKRYRWKEFLGCTLTKKILLLKKEGVGVRDAFNQILSNKEVQKFLEQYPYEKENLIKNLEISVHARYAENNSANKIMEKGDVQ